MEEQCLCKIQACKKNYFLFTTVKNNGKAGFDLILCDGQTSWNGEISGDDVKKQCALATISYDTFVELTVLALTGKVCEDIDFLYEVNTSSAETVWLYWKKHIISENIKFQLGHTKLQKTVESCQMIEKIFDHCIGSIVELNHQITSMKTDNERLLQERTNALKRLDKCVTAKEKLEQNLYSKFLVVLNSKKNEISRLRKKVGEMKSDAKNVPILNQQDEMSVDNSSVYSLETEEEEENNAVSDKLEMKRNDSLVFSDDSDDESRFNLKINQAKGQGSGSKDILPKSSSVESNRSKIKDDSFSMGNKSLSEISNISNLIDDI